MTLPGCEREQPARKHVRPTERWDVAYLLAVVLIKGWSLSMVMRMKIAPLTSFFLIFVPDQWLAEIDFAVLLSSRNNKQNSM